MGVRKFHYFFTTLHYIFSYTWTYQWIAFLIYYTYKKFQLKILCRFDVCRVYNFRWLFSESRIFLLLLFSRRSAVLFRPLLCCDWSSDYLWFIYIEHWLVIYIYICIYTPVSGRRNLIYYLHIITWVSYLVNNIYFDITCFQ